MEKVKRTVRESLLEWGWSHLVVGLMSDEECESLLESVVMYPEG
jgi:hypothetical protein